MKKIFGIADKFRKLLSLGRKMTPEERLQDLSTYLVGKADTALKRMGAKIYIDEVIPQRTKEAPRATIDIYFKPLEYSEENASHFNEIASQMQDFLDMYYGTVRMEFYTRVTMTPENIPNTSRREAMKAPTKEIYI